MKCELAIAPCRADRVDVRCRTCGRDATILAKVWDALFNGCTASRTRPAPIIRAIMALRSQQAQQTPMVSESTPDAVGLALVFAVARNGTIGVAGGLPWRLPEDLKRFRALTAGHAVIMGRKTWASLPRALPQRQNIVVTRDRGFVAHEAEVVHSLDEALACVRCPPPVFCIGGAELAKIALPRADTLYLTEIDRDFAGDVALPRVDRTQWREVAREAHRLEGPDGFDFAFVTYARMRPPDA
jgi:dihydrofolate reductase